MPAFCIHCQEEFVRARNRWDDMLEIDIYYITENSERYRCTHSVHKEKVASWFCNVFPVFHGDGTPFTDRWERVSHRIFRRCIGVWWTRVFWDVVAKTHSWKNECEFIQRTMYRIACLLPQHNTPLFKNYPTVSILQKILRLARIGGNSYGLDWHSRRISHRWRGQWYNIGCIWFHFFEASCVHAHACSWYRVWRVQEAAALV